MLVRRDGYETRGQTVVIRPGGMFDASLDLRPVAARPPVAEAAPPPVRAPRAGRVPAARPRTIGTGTVEILVRPWGRIEIDGVTHHEETDVVYRAELTAGDHRVVVSHPSLGSDERTVTVSPGSRTRIEFNLASGTGGR